MFSLPSLDMARPKQKAPNPISAAVKEWLDDFLNGLEGAALVPDTEIEALIAAAPKRWVTYEPMVLLPSGSFTSTSWTQLLARASSDARDELWKKILLKIGKKASEKTTHLAVNDGIPLTLASEPTSDSSSHHQEQENILRSPIGLRTLYGDFGPSESYGPSVSDEDFARAFWVSTKQNGIHQTWAPRWTMFSRGNVKEKARLLAFHDGLQQDELAHRNLPRSALTNSWAIDLYGGIGYFVFSYAKLGMRVLCWELNAWSVEGLRRGARANGWSVKVVKGEEGLGRPTPELISDDDMIVVFLENNNQAARRVRELRSHGVDLSVVHVNCGLLPRSDDSWEAAREILGEKGEDGWLHLHENVAVKDIESRKAEIQHTFDEWDRCAGSDRAASVEHVELVKTFAPDVWHCVFDVYITKSRSIIAP